MRPDRSSKQPSPGNRSFGLYARLIGLILIALLAALAVIAFPGLRNTLMLSVFMLLILISTWMAGVLFVRRRVRTALGAVRRDLVVSGSDEIAELVGAFDQATQTLEMRDHELLTHKTRIDRLNRAYAFLSGINTAIRAIHERGALCSEVCRLAIETGGFRLAWAGLFDAEIMAFNPRWHTGDTGDYLEHLRPALARADFAPAIKPLNGEIFVCNDMALASDSSDGHAQALALGLRSYTLLPLRAAGDVIAVLGLYTDEADFFDDQEIALLREIASETSLCLDYIEKEERLHHLAHYDALTELPNQLLFTDRLDQALARERYRSRFVGLIMAHVERFKEVNTTHGPQMGDVLLWEIGRRLTETVRTGDTVARTGTAGFGVILLDLAQPGDAALVARNIVQAFENPFAIGEHDIYITLSLGIAISPDDGRDSETLLRNAAAAQTMVRRDTGARYRFYTPEIDANSRELFILEGELRRALERGEFALHYQPIVDVQSRNIVGSEALLRWHNPRLGAVSPGAFIPVAEKTGLIVPIGEWALATARQQALRWHSAGLPAKIAVNVSAIQLRQPNFEERARAIFSELGTPDAPTALTLELTESHLMENAEHTVTQLSNLRDAGFSISIDDFGTGYSSLSYLKRLPIDAMKIDISFIRDLTRDPDDSAIVRAIIALAHSLELKVVAEGVETAEQLAILKELKCDLAQGYLFSPAVSAEKFAALCGAKLSVA